jgi:FtsP/CotA-like multicopper oxidase with cupredoxin domain
MASKVFSRRDFLRVTGLGAGAVFGSKLVGWGEMGRTARLLADPTPTPHGHTGPTNAEPFKPDAEISITAVEKTVQLLPGASTRVWGYQGELLSGSGAAVQEIPNCYLGPVLRVKSGTKVRLHFRNKLAEKSIVHPHGLRVPENCDGDPMQAIDPGQTLVYDFQVIDRAGPYWFHPHPMMRTAEQVYLGMAGVFYVWDDEEETAVPGASSGVNDIPVIIQDRIFDRNNQLLYQPNMMWGALGDRILVNGTLDARCALEPRGYRLRLLNGSNARTYKLAWSNGMPLRVIGTDGGLLSEAVTRSYITLSPGERVDVWADFSSLAGQQVVLKSLSFEAGMGMMAGMGMGMMGGMSMGGMGMRGRGMGGIGMGMMGGGLVNGSPMDILRVDVGNTASASPELGTLPPLNVQYDSSNVSNFTTPRPFTLSMGMMMSWSINGRQYQTSPIAEDEKVMVDEPLAWEFVNLSPIPHPMHIHNIQFQVVQRIVSSLASYASVSQGFVDSGWKDTVLVWPGERVKIAMKFGPHTGMYMYHCHILEHEDMDMMRNFMIMEKM